MAQCVPVPRFSRLGPVTKHAFAERRVVPLDLRARAGSSPEARLPRVARRLLQSLGSSSTSPSPPNPPTEVVRLSEERPSPLPTGVTRFIETIAPRPAMPFITGVTPSNRAHGHPHVAPRCAQQLGELLSLLPLRTAPPQGIDLPRIALLSKRRDSLGPPVAFSLAKGVWHQPHP